VADYAIVAGVPARAIGDVRERRDRDATFTGSDKDSA